MEIIALLDSLKLEMEELFKDDKYEIKGVIDTDPVAYKGVTVNTGWYVEKRSREEFPYIMISPLSDTSDWEENTLRVMCIFGVYGQSEDAWKDAAHMANKAKLHFTKNYVVAKRFALDRDKRITIEYPDGQPYPQWFVLMTLEFHSYNIASTGADNEWIGGYNDR